MAQLAISKGMEWNGTDSLVCVSVSGWVWVYVCVSVCWGGVCVCMGYGFIPSFVPSSLFAGGGGGDFGPVKEACE